MTEEPGYRRRDDHAYPPYDHDDYRSTLLRAPSQSRIPLPHTISELTGPGPALAEVMPEDAD